MKTMWMGLLLLPVILTGCGNPVPDVADARHIVVDGQAMDGLVFLKTYCGDQVAHPTCMRVKRALLEDMTRPNSVPRFGVGS